MELDRIQLNEDGSMQPQLQGYVSKVQQPLKGFQNWVDNRQETINSSGSPFLREAAQPVQDVQNMIAHPIQTGRTMVDEAVTHPYQTAFNLTPIGMYYNSTKFMIPKQNETVGDWGQRTAGHIAGELPLLMLGLGTGLRAPTIGKVANNVIYKPKYPIKGSLGGDMIKGPALPKNYSTVSVQDYLDLLEPQTITVYHGSPNQTLTSLSPKFSGKNTAGVAKGTVSLSDSPSYATNYAYQGGVDGALYKTEINPSLFIEDTVPINKQVNKQLTSIAREFGYDPNIKGIDLWNKLYDDYKYFNRNKPLNQYLKEKGIEGVHFKDAAEYASINETPVQKIKNIPYKENIYNLGE